MTALGFVLLALLASQSAVLARVFKDPSHISWLSSSKLSATQDSCRDCIQILELFVDMISNADTQELIKNTVDGFCARMPGSESQEACLNRTKEYLPIAIQFLVKSIKPGETCMFLGLCSRLSEGKEEELLTNHIADGDIASVVPLRGNRPVVQVSPQCTFCVFIIKKLESMLPKERTEDAVVKLLDKVCKILPKVYEKQCDHFIDKYGKQLIDFLLSSAAPHTVCMLLHLCLVQELPVVEMPPPSECDSCQTLTALSRLHLGSNLTESRTSSFLESVCRLHPLAIPKCEVFTQRYGFRLQKILGKQGDALDMCQEEGLCAAADGVKKLAEDRCSWGREHVCADMRTALECDSVLLCQKFVWN